MRDLPCFSPMVPISPARCILFQHRTGTRPNPCAHPTQARRYRLHRRVLPPESVGQRPPRKPRVEGFWPVPLLRSSNSNGPHIATLGPRSASNAMIRRGVPPKGEKMIDVKRMLPIAVALLAAAGQPVLAEEAPAATEQPGSWFPGTFTGTVALTNDYIFRGMSQTDDNPTIQGSINYTLDTGFYGTSVYGGVWGSNLDFNDDAATNNGAHLELDWTFGFMGNILDTGIGYTLGAIYYNYPGARSGLSYDY